MLRQIIGPVVEFCLQSRHLLQRKLVRGCCRIVLLKHLGQDARRPKESQRARQARALTRKRRQKALFGDILVVNVVGIFRVDILFLDQLGETKRGGREAVQRVQRPEDLLARLDGESAIGEALLGLVQAQSV